MVLTSSTGGGHNMRARSLAQWTAKERPGWKIDVHSALESTHGLYRFGVELYNTIQRTWPQLHHLYFNYLEVAAMFKDGKRILGRGRYVEVLENFRPDVIVSVHGSTNHGFFEIARHVLGRDKVKCVTYCAEMWGGYGMSRHWVSPDADLFIGSMPETVDAAIDLGMPRAKAMAGGFLLHPSFYSEIEYRETEDFWRGTLQLDPDKFTVILSTGANSANNHERFLRVLHRVERPLQVVALCGSNDATRWRVEELAPILERQGIVVRALPTTDKMALLMRSASAIVARPGSGTTNEAIQSGCPILFNRLGGIMPQEMITERFCDEHRISLSIRKPGDLPPILRDWIDHPEHREGFLRRMEAVRPRVRPVNLLETLERLHREGVPE
ncbi:MAG TPA: glycosyltransferase [Candidatus Methylacidiphilales bacterium]